MRVCLASLILGLGLAAQQPLLEVKLAADPDHSGPSAWTWVRSEVLTRLPTWPEGRDPFASVRLTIFSPTACEIAPGASLEKSYLKAKAKLSSDCSIDIHCQWNGVETWDLHGIPKGRYAQLASLLGLDLGRTPLTFDCLAVTSTLVGATIEGDHRGRILTWGAEECGEIDIHYWQTEGAVRIRAASRGGLLLPALLTVLADWHSHPASSLALAGRQIDRADRLILRAVAARHEERDEAIRQLSVLGDPRVVPVLERLLFEDSSTRVLTIDSLVRIKASRSLPRLLAAGTDAIAGSEAMAKVALWTLWADAKPETRQQIRDRIAPEQASALDAWHLGGLRPAAPQPIREPRTQANASGDLHRAAWIGLWLTLGGLGLMYFRVRRLAT